MTTPSHVQGACAILSTKALRIAQDLLQCENITLLPSSIHEIIAINDDGIMKISELRSMVREINSTVLSPQEFLSDNIMRYDGMKLTMVVDEPEMDNGIPFMEEHKLHYAGMKM